MKRRDFLKFTGLGSLGLLIKGVDENRSLELEHKAGTPNVSKIQDSEDYNKAHIMGVATESIQAGSIVKVQI